MAAEEPDDRWTITFRALSVRPERRLRFVEDAKFDADALEESPAPIVF